MKKVILLMIIFLMIIASSISTKAEHIDVEIRVVDLTEGPVSNALIQIWNETGGEIVSCCAVTGNDGIVNLRIHGTEGFYIIQVFSFSGVDKPQSRGRELASERRYIFNSTVASDTIYEIVVDEINGSKSDTNMYEIANGSLNMAKKSLEISNNSLNLSKWAFLIAIVGVFISAVSGVSKITKMDSNKKKTDLNQYPFLNRKRALILISIAVFLLIVIGLFFPKLSYVIELGFVALIVILTYCYTAFTADILEDGIKQRKVAFKERQLEKLYLPLEDMINHNSGFKLHDIKAYTYLAMTDRSEENIKKYLKIREDAESSRYTADDSENQLISTEKSNYDDVKKLVENDIEYLKIQLNELVD